MTEKEFLKHIITDVKVKLSSEFDKNFERKAFFDKKWKTTKLMNRRGSLMVRSGKLRRGNIAKENYNGINWSNSMPHADLHNNGGKIKVTDKMKRFFWAMYYKTSGALTKTKSGAISNNKRNRRMSDEASQWKALALQKTGKLMTIEQRQFIGNHPQVEKFVKEIINKNFDDFNADFAKRNNFK